jgi:hypothetical protein
MNGTLMRRVTKGTHSKGENLEYGPETGYCLWNTITAGKLYGELSILFI